MNRVKDVSLNIIASMLTTFTLQIIIYPFISHKVSIVDYGYTLTVMGSINFISVGIGSGLMNMRLMEQGFSQNRSDYNFMVKFVLTFIGFSYLGLVLLDSDIPYLTPIFVLTCIMFLKTYYSVVFRLKINYIKVVLMNLVTSIGYIIGLSIFAVWNSDWIYIFLCGEIFSLLYIITNYEKTENLNVVSRTESLKKFYYYASGSLIGNLILYLDRLVLFPILGPESVSVFVVASFVGKMMGLILNPISGVTLTYIAKKNEIGKKEFSIFCLASVFSSFLFFLGTVNLSHVIISLLYPKVYPLTIEYIFFANFSAILFILGNIINPYLIKLCHEKWQLLTQLIYLIFYLLGGVWVLNVLDLFAFIIFTTIINAVRVILLYIIVISFGTFNSNSREKEVAL